MSRLIAFGATVYAARIIGPAYYGAIGVAVAVVLYCNRVVDAGFELGLGVREIAADPGFLDRAVPTVLTFRTLLALVLTVGLSGGAYLLLPAPDRTVLAVQAITLLAVGLNPRWVHLGYRRAKLAAVAATLGQATMAVVILALVRSPSDVAVVPGAQVAGDFLTATILLVALRRLGGPHAIRLDWSVLRPLLPRSWHLVASALLGIVIYSAGLLFLRGFEDRAAAGFFTAAYTLVTFFLNVGVMYNLSLLPSLTRLAGDRPGQHTLYHSALAHVFAVGFPAAVGGAYLAGPIIAAIYGPTYQAAALPLALLIWSIPLNLVRDVALMGLIAGGRERSVFRVTLAAAGVSVLASAVLVPTLGLVGAGLATLIAETFRMVLALIVARRHSFPLPIAGRFVAAGVAGLLMGAVLWGAGPGSVWIGVPLGALAYLIGLVLTGGLRLRGRRLPELTV